MHVLVGVLVRECVDGCVDEYMAGCMAGCSGVYIAGCIGVCVCGVGGESKHSFVVSSQC